MALLKSPYCLDLPGTECINEKSHRQALCTRSQAWPHGVLIKGSSVWIVLVCRVRLDLAERDGDRAFPSDGNNFLSSMVGAGAVSPLGKVS